tara:strand:- start:563 stop:748 length:186 start_codon:yes stop_codon:yes gene_type:complete
MRFFGRRFMMIDNNKPNDASQEIDTQDVRQGSRAPGLVWVLVGGIVVAVLGFGLSALFAAG